MVNGMGREIGVVVGRDVYGIVGVGKGGVDGCCLFSIFQLEILPGRCYQMVHSSGVGSVIVSSQ